MFKMQPCDVCPHDILPRRKIFIDQRKKVLVAAVWHFILRRLGATLKAARHQLNAELCQTQTYRFKVWEYEPDQSVG